MFSKDVLTTQQTRKYGLIKGYWQIKYKNKIYFKERPVKTFDLKKRKRNQKFLILLSDEEQFTKFSLLQGSVSEKIVKIPGNIMYVYFSSLSICYFFYLNRYHSVIITANNVLRPEVLMHVSIFSFYWALPSHYIYNKVRLSQIISYVPILQFFI